MIHIVPTIGVPVATSEIKFHSSTDDDWDDLLLPALIRAPISNRRSGDIALQRPRMCWAQSSLAFGISHLATL
jgi:hypothetical protein